MLWGPKLTDAAKCTDGSNWRKADLRSGLHQGQLCGTKRHLNLARFPKIRTACYNKFTIVFEVITWKFMTQTSSKQEVVKRSSLSIQALQEPNNGEA